MTEQPLGQRAARGAVFTVVSQLAGLLVQVLSVVVLSRLLSPRDYGLVATVLVVVAFGETFRDLGLSSASVQASGIRPPTLPPIPSEVLSSAFCAVTSTRLPSVFRCTSVLVSLS